jgi:hypothetical protein
VAPKSVWGVPLDWKPFSPVCWSMDSCAAYVVVSCVVRVVFLHHIGMFSHLFHG